MKNMNIIWRTEKESPSGNIKL